MKVMDLIYKRKVISQTLSGSYVLICYIGIIGILLLSIIFSLCLGRYNVTPSEIISTLFSGEESPFISTILFNIRLPRIMMAILAGGVLTLSGCSYQAVFRNPMVSPDILGVSSGAACGAAIAILMSMSSLGIQLMSFLFGLLAVSATFLVSRVLKRVNDQILMLILAGIVISSLFGSMISLFKYIADPDSKLPAITFWMMGSFNSVTMENLKGVLPVVLCGTIPLILISWKLNVLSLNEDEAYSLGINPNTIRIITIFCSTLITASIVSLTGLIGWVGLIIPHFCRFLIGSDNRILMPFSFLTGSVFLLWIDNISRTVSTLEIPIGIITAIIGSPLFLFFLSKRRKDL